MSFLFLLFLLAVAPLANSYHFKTLTGNPPLVIGHRGACGYRPEHTYGSHELAIDLGADVIEVDIVSSKDRALVIMHENELSLTTDVESHPEFQWRKTSKYIDGITWTGWFVEDFTLGELKTLRVQQDRLKPWRTRDFDGLWQIPTLTEITKLIHAKEKEKQRTIGLFVELKKPTYFRALNRSLEEPLMEVLTQAGYDLHKNESYDYLLSPPPLLLESFDRRCVQLLNQLTSGVPLTQLVHLQNVRIPGEQNASYGDLITDSGLQKIRTYATGIGVISQLIIPVDEDYLYLLPPTDLVSRAHATGLVVHVWTFRSDKEYLNHNYKSPEDEYVAHFNLGIDGGKEEEEDQEPAKRTRRRKTHRKKQQKGRSNKQEEKEDQEEAKGRRKRRSKQQEEARSKKKKREARSKEEEEEEEQNRSKEKEEARRKKKHEAREKILIPFSLAISDFPDVAFRVRKQLLIDADAKLAPTWLALCLLTALTLLFLSLVWVLKCAQSNDQKSSSSRSRGKPLALSSDEENNL